MNSGRRAHSSRQITLWISCTVFLTHIGATINVCFSGPRFPSALNHLSIVRASANSSTFNKYVPGGEFASVQGFAVIKLHSFSRFSTFLRQHFPFLFPQSPAPVQYSAIQTSFMFDFILNFSKFKCLSEG